MFRKIQIYMGDAPSCDSSEGPGDEATLRGILLCGRSNRHLACELYCQLVKQTHRCMNAENEVSGEGNRTCLLFAVLLLSKERGTYVSMYYGA